MLIRMSNVWQKWSLAFICVAFFWSSPALASTLAKSRVENPDVTNLHYDPSVAFDGHHKLQTQTYSNLASITPYEFNLLYKVWPRSLQIQAEKDLVLRRKLALERYGFYPNPTLESSHRPPFGFHENNMGQWVLSCTGCHAGPVRKITSGKLTEQIVIGAPNIKLDFATFVEDRMRLYAQFKPDLNKGLSLYDQGSLWLAQEFYRNYTLKNQVTSSRGTITPWNIVPPLMKLRTQEMRLSLTGILSEALSFAAITYWPFFAEDFDGMKVADLDIPAWWNTPLKQRLYYDGFTPVSPRYLLFGSLEPQFETRQLEDDALEFIEYFKSIEVPKFPGVIDGRLADSGHLVFMKTCAKCHGIYERTGKLVWYESKIINISSVGTDDYRLNEGMTAKFQERVQSSWFGMYGLDKIIINSPGYVAPPLRGLWASAPYFHNGSVPTVKDILFSNDRPKIWKADYAQYDTDRVGLVTQNYFSLPSGLDNNEKRKYFDTALIGKSNKGHRFPDQLSDSQKLELLEFLKRL